MKLYDAIRNKKEKISIIGLGYVGMPLAVAFSKVADVVGFDISKEKVQQYLNGIDVTKEVGNEVIRQSSVLFTWDEKDISDCKFHIVAVPTPINQDKTPDLKPVLGASRTVGRNLVRDSIVVFESTVYPGVTEDICIPILEEESGLKCGVDFKVGYSPERINPGDRVHRLENIVKIVSGMDEESLENIAKIYEMIISAGVHRAESIKVAEAAKVIENSQRDINIAFMNELSIVFNKMGIDTKSVLEAAGTKWNFLNFTPGLVGGHCIGVDPYYFIYRAEELGYHSQIILAGRRINDEMGKYVAENTVKQLIKAGKKVKGANVAIFGITFKENCPDSRNTRVVDIIKELDEYEVNTLVVDPIANKEEVENEYGIQLVEMDKVNNVDAIIFAVAHDSFKELELEDLNNYYRNELNNNVSDNSLDRYAQEKEFVLIDIKSIFNRKEVESKNYLYWSL
ncbi:nucleotide sugar dehydrogenase [Bacillus sp. BGMRC 2118]|nr:nucleotide sugar dehydrogenase [Bacillus sp. BGMRC 2118]